jgi:hypothetical protein
MEPLAEPRTLSFLDIRAALHRLAEGGRAMTPGVSVAQLLRFWLWGTDANEDCERVKCTYHQMHLTGMVCGMALVELYGSSGPDGAAVVIFNDDDARTLVFECAVFLPHCYTAVADDADAAQAAATAAAASPEVTVAQTEEVAAAASAVAAAATGDDGRGASSSSCRVLPSADAVQMPTSVTLQQLRDLVQAVQTQWPSIQRAVVACATRAEQLELLQVVDRMVNQLFVWFTSYMFCSDIPEWQADDREFVDHTPPTHALALTEMGVKFFLNIFFVLYRLLYLQRHAVAAPRRAGYPFSVETFHVEAGVDDFHTLGMYHDIPPGCLLEYKHSYSGYFNNVSQVVYRHFPSYKQRQVATIEEVLAHDAPDLCVVPALKQIYPEVEFAFEDHHFSREVAGVHRAVLLQEYSSTRQRAANESAAAARQQQQQPGSGLRRAAAAAAAAAEPIPCASESLSRRVAACLGSGGDAGGAGAPSAGAEGGGDQHVQAANWLWFCIGGTVYLVSNTEGVAYSGCARDLLALYLRRVGVEG